MPAGDVLPEQTGLSVGAFGPGVAQLQHRLIELGHLAPEAIRVCEGMYGPRTAEAIARAAKLGGVGDGGPVYTEQVRAFLLEEIVGNADSPKARADERAAAQAAAAEADAAEADAADAGAAGGPYAAIAELLSEMGLAVPAEADLGELAARHAGNVQRIVNELL